MNLQEGFKRPGNTILQIAGSDHIGGGTAGWASVCHCNAKTSPSEHIGIVVSISEGADGVLRNF